MWGFSWWKRTAKQTSPESEEPAPTRHFVDATRSTITPEELEAIRTRAPLIEAERAKERSMTGAATPEDAQLRAVFLNTTHCTQSFDLQCVGIDDQPLDIDVWGQDVSGPLYQVAADLLQLRDSGLGFWDAGKKALRIPDVVLATLPEHYLPTIGLPTIGNIELKIRTTGVLYTKNFAVKQSFLHNGNPIQFPHVDGMTIRFGQKYFTLPSPIFYATQALNEYSAGTYTTDEERNYAWAKATSVVSLSPLKANLIDQVGTAKLRAALRLSIEKDKNGNIFPVFLNPSYNADGKEDFSPMLSPKEAKEAARYLQSQFALSGHIPVGNRSYLFMTPEIQSVVKVIRKINKSKDPSVKASFFASPTAAIIRELEQTGDPNLTKLADDIDAVFVETPEYLSQRIEAFGEWEPKSLSFVKPVTADWFGDGNDHYGIYIGRDFVWVKPTELTNLIHLIEKNQAEGNSTVTFHEQVLDIDGFDVSQLKALNKKIKLDEEDPSKGKEGLEEDKSIDGTSQKKKHYGPILKTNIDELEYEAEQNRHDDYTHAFTGLVPPYSLYPHQEECLEWLKDLWRQGLPGALLADDMGLGKTLQSLSFLFWLAEGHRLHDKSKPSLIIAPAGLIANWAIEAKKYFGDAAGYPLVVSGQTARDLRRKMVSDRLYAYSNAGIVISTYETVRDKLDLFLNVDWNLLILDEAQKAKNPVSRLTNAVASLEAEFVLAMTGTPVENQYLDLWSIMNIAVPGFLRSAREFAKNFCDDASIERAGTELNAILMGEETLPDGKVEKHGFQLMLRRLKTERLKGLPEKREEVCRQTMPPEQANAYRQILNQRTANLANEQESIPGLVLLQRLMACSLSPTEIQAGTELTDDLIQGSARLTALFKILEEIKAKNEKALIFVTHLDIQQALAREIQKRFALDHLPGTINGSMQADARQRIVNAFQNAPENEFDVLVLSSRAAGTGLTLTAANHVIHLERWWNPAVEDQCSDRAYRIGQKRNVTIHLPLAVFGPNDMSSFDDKLNAFLATKRIRSAHVLQPANTDDKSKQELVQAILSD